MSRPTVAILDLLSLALDACDKSLDSEDSPEERDAYSDLRSRLEDAIDVAVAVRDMPRAAKVSP